MPAVALKDGHSQVTCTDGIQGSVCATDDGTPIKWHWDIGTTFASDTGSSDVFVEGIGVVTVGDTMQPHPWGEPCTPTPIDHSPEILESNIQGTPNVYAGGKLIARIGDKYNSESFDHTISTGSSTVFIG
jgi:uncharacterized Zn-binding protein involved in type VI secretion